jgi:excisionase family DNA binding protein
MNEHQRLLIRQDEACRRLGICPRTLLGEIKAGRLQYVLVGKRRHFKPADLDAYIERQTRGWPRTNQPFLDGEPDRHTPTRISPSTVIDFEEALALTEKKKPKTSPKNSNTRRRGGAAADDR